MKVDLSVQFEEALHNTGRQLYSTMDKLDQYLLEKQQFVRIYI